MRSRALSSIPPPPVRSGSIRHRGSSSSLPGPRGHEPLAGLTVLVVDPAPDTREMVVEYVALHGAKAISTATVAEALVVLGGFHVDVVVADLSAPDEAVDEPGAGLIEHMELHPAWRAIGCVMVSCEPPDAARADDSRRIVVLRKPFELQRIVSAVLDVNTPEGEHEP